jgi:hypothetical protein
MDKDFQVLEAELRRTFGDEGPLPKRTHFRGMKRLDLRQVICLSNESPASVNLPIIQHDSSLFLTPR